MIPRTTSALCLALSLLKSVSTFGDALFHAPIPIQFRSSVDARRPVFTVKYPSSSPQFLSDHPDPGNRIVYVSNEIKTLPPKHYVQSSPQFAQAKQRALGMKPLTAQQIAQQQYSSALSNMATATFQANSQKLYIVNVVSPYAPAEAQFPDRREELKPVHPETNFQPPVQRDVDAGRMDAAG